MDARSALIVGLFVAGSWNGYQQWEHRTVHPRDGQLVAYDPHQTEIRSALTVRRGRWTLTPKANYDITARVLGNESYSFDRLAGLVPEDLALGWGPMSDNQILKTLDVSQSARFFTWRPHDDSPIAREEIVTHSANTHVIPADSGIQEQLGRLRVGQVVRLTGTLVDATRDDGAWIRTSLVRTDTGAGACEVMLVESVDITSP
jgi:hypothetical protein